MFFAIVSLKISVLFYLLHELLHFLTVSYISCTAQYMVHGNNYVILLDNCLQCFWHAFQVLPGRN